MDSQLPVANNPSQSGNLPPLPQEVILDKKLPAQPQKRLIANYQLPIIFIFLIVIAFSSSFFFFSRQSINKKLAVKSAPLTPTAPPPSPTPDLGTVLITMYPIPTDTPEEKSQAVDLTPVAFTIVAENDTFTPAQITVRVGQIITLNFTAKDKDYDITIPQLGMRRTIKKGETKSLEFQAQTFGQFLFACASGCNSTTARGLLTIKP